MTADSLKLATALTDTVSTVAPTGPMFDPPVWLTVTAILVILAITGGIIYGIYSIFK